MGFQTGFLLPGVLLFYLAGRVTYSTGNTTRMNLIGR